MDQFIAQVVVDEVPRRSTQIAIVVCEALESTIDECKHTKASDVKLALVVQSGPLDILLYNEGFLLVIIALAQDAFYLSQC